MIDDSISGKDIHYWYKNGDHPDDYKDEVEGFENGIWRKFSPAFQKGLQWEGQVVGYFRDPDVDGKTICPECQRTMHVHGWIDQGSDGLSVCPGDGIADSPMGYVILKPLSR
jgi:hypothetical protein